MTQPIDLWGPRRKPAGMVVVCRTCHLQPWSCLRAQHAGRTPGHQPQLTLTTAAQARAAADRTGR